MAGLQTRPKHAKPPPAAPTSLSQVKAKELHKILRPFGDATDKLQADSITSHLVLLSIATAVSSKYFIII